MTLHDRAVRNLQEIELTVVEQDSRSAKQSFTCSTANVSNKAGNRNSDTSSEYITSDMFKAFMDAHNKQMESVQKLLSLNSLYYEEVSEEEDDYFSEEEEEIIPRKRSRIDQVSLSSISSQRNPSFSSTCVPPFSIQSCRSCYTTQHLCQRSFFKIFVKFRNSKKKMYLKLF